MIQFVDTYPELLILKAQAEKHPEALLDFWKEYIKKYGFELQKKLIDDSKDYDYTQDIQPVLIACLTTDFYKVESAHRAFIKTTNQLNRNFHELFDCNENITVYFYCGLCNGAGWATYLNEKQIVLLGVEKIAELNWYTESRMKALLFHELCHQAHDLLRMSNFCYELTNQSDQSIWQLYREGFAQRYEQVLCRQDDFFHQDKEGWLLWCKHNKKRLAEEFLNRVLQNKQTNDFFGDWNSFCGHSDVGYFFGCEFIKAVENIYSVTEIANFSQNQLQTLIIDFLKTTCQKE